MKKLTEVDDAHLSGVDCSKIELRFQVNVTTMIYMRDLICMHF